MELTQETASVSHIDGNYVHLKTINSSACGSCAAKPTCGSLKLFKKSSPTLRLVNTLNVKSGDTVIIGLATDSLLFGSILLYLAPLLSLFVFAAMGEFLGDEPMSIILGLAGLLLGLWFTKLFVGRTQIAKKFEPTLIRKVINIELA